MIIVLWIFAERLVFLVDEYLDEIHFRFFHVKSNVGGNWKVRQSPEKPLFQRFSLFITAKKRKRVSFFQLRMEMVAVTSRI